VYVCLGYKKVSNKIKGFSSPPLIYNMRSEKWVHEFIRDSSKGLDSAMIGGIVAGTVVIVIIAVVSFIIVRRRRRQRRDQHAGTRDSQSTLRHNHDPVLPSMENEQHGAVPMGEFSQASPSENHFVSDPMIMPVDNPQSVPSSPIPGQTSFQDTVSAWSPPPAYSSPVIQPPAIPRSVSPRPIISLPVIPPCPTTQYNHMNYQDYIQLFHNQPPLHQEQIVPRNADPQDDFAVSPTLSSSGVRSPHGTAEPGLRASDQELLEQINSLQAEWIRRRAMNQP
jgi:hypothetical protein